MNYRSMTTQFFYTTSTPPLKMYPPSSPSRLAANMFGCGFMHAFFPTFARYDLYHIRSRNICHASFLPPYSFATGELNTMDWRLESAVGKFVALSLRFFWPKPHAKPDVQFLVETPLSPLCPRLGRATFFLHPHIPGGFLEAYSTPYSLPCYRVSLRVQRIIYNYRQSRFGLWLGKCAFDKVIHRV